MERDHKPDRIMVSLEELAYTNMVLVEAMFELLAEKGLFTREEVKERVKKLRDETRLNLRRPQ